MNRRYIFQICLILSFFASLVYGRSLSYDDLDSDRTKSSSSEAEEPEVQDLNSDFLKTWNDNNQDNDNLPYDSYEERKFHERSLFTSSRAPHSYSTHTLSAHTRQILIDILQKALDQGWRPNLKHYIPGTRFGRHRR